VRSAAALALIAVVLAGCAKERPSALSIAACLRDHGAEVKTVTLRHSPTGPHDDWTGVVFVNYSTFESPRGPEELRRALMGGESGLLIVARSDADARRLQAEFRAMTGGSLTIPTRGSVVYTATPLARRCRMKRPAPEYRVSRSSSTAIPADGATERRHSTNIGSSWTA